VARTSQNAGALVVAFAGTDVAPRMVAPGIEAEGGVAEPGPEFRELRDGGEPPAGDGRKVRLLRHQEIGVSAPVRAAHAPPQLVELRKPVAVGPVHD